MKISYVAPLLLTHIGAVLIGVLLAGNPPEQLEAPSVDVAERAPIRDNSDVQLRNGATPATKPDRVAVPVSAPSTSDQPIEPIHDCLERVNQLEERLHDMYALSGDLPESWSHSKYARSLPDEDRETILRGLRRGLPIYPSIWQSEQVLRVMRETQHVDHDGVCTQSCLSLRNAQVQRLIDIIGLDAWLSAAEKSRLFGGTARTKDAASPVNWYVDENFWLSEFGVELPEQFQ